MLRLREWHASAAAVVTAEGRLIGIVTEQDRRWPAVPESAITR